MRPIDIADAARAIEAFSEPSLTVRVRNLESEFGQATLLELSQRLDGASITHELLASASAVKTLAAQVNVTIHTIGILLCLPHLLGPGERVMSLSLGAGSGKKQFDLVTDRRVAEFKFIHWRGADSVRQNGLFKDFYRLAEFETTKAKMMYVLGKEHPLRFLRGNRRVESALPAKSLWHSYQAKYGSRHTTVGEYFGNPP